MSFLQVLIFGIVEGITEFLPISSTGHLILTAKILNVMQSEFTKSFEIIIQLGAILSVVVIYWKRLVQGIDIWKRLLTAFIPTAIIGGLLYKVIKEYLIGNNSVVLWSLFAGGIFLVIFELFYHSKEEVQDLSSISYRQALVIGIFQSLAVVPGVSRAAATIIGGLVMGLNRKTIVEFSFLLAIPTMFAATVLDLAKSAGAFKLEQLGDLAAGFIISFLVAGACVKFLLVFIKKHNFISFGIYRIIIALIFWFIVR